MKTRNDFVTNSSSSSFLISKSEVSLDFLINTVMKDFYIELNKQWDEDEDTDWESEYSKIDILNNDDTIFTINEISEHQWDDYDDMYWSLNESKVKENKEYEIYNNCGIRFNWDIVTKVMDKYAIKWRYGYND